MQEGDLVRLVAGGETDSVEFKSEFPANAVQLAKEIAALASTNGGCILLGVSDDGAIVGLNVADPSEQRALKERIDGLCAQAIVPPVQVQVEHVMSNARGVTVIHVPASSEDVHYVQGRPYVRHLSISRVATPEEVKQRILLADVLKRLHDLESKQGSAVAAAIQGQGELATLNRVDLFEILRRRESRKIP